MDNDEEIELKYFDPELALSYYDEEEILLAQLKFHIKAFDKAGPFDKLVLTYKKFDWHIIGTEEWLKFERETHSLKGRVKYMALPQLSLKLERLQYAIRDGHFISVGMLMEKVLQAARPSHQALLEYLKEPLDNLFNYEANEQYDFYAKLCKNQVKQGSKVQIQPPKLEETHRVARFLAMKRDPGLKCDWNEDIQEDENSIKCTIF